MKTITRAAAAVLVLAPLSVVSAAGDGSVAENRPVYRATDPATGAELRAYRQAGQTSLEIDHPDVIIRKTLTDGRSITTLAAGDDRVTISVDRQGWTVARDGREASASRQQPGGMEQARRILAASIAVRQATTLLGRLALPPQSPLLQTILVTRAMLLGAAGDDSGADAAGRHIRQIQARRLGASLVRASTQETPTSCWDTYASEAIGAFLEYEECVTEEQWWDVLGKWACYLIYEMQAIGAFAWWLTCIGLH